jgi:hypothetical protein
MPALFQAKRGKIFKLKEFIFQPLALSQFMPSIVAAHYSNIKIERRHSKLSDNTVNTLTRHSEINRERYQYHGGN